MTSLSQAVDQDALKAKFGVSNVKRPISLVIWTTTPWTLPANRAISIAPDFDYAGWCRSTVRP
ncbi:hypothetical protein ACLB1E_00395 [Escherichia coli]